jgi:CheY-like chemotaxis protein
VLQPAVAPPAAPVPSPVDPLAADTPLDPATARRLEDLVEREIKLQHEFTPGAAVERPGRAGRATVMVVDDSVDARTILSIYLSRTGYQVVTAASAEDCLAKLRHHTVDAIVLDATMPGGGAEHFLRVVHSDPAYVDRARVPVIIYTAHPETMTRDRARQLGASDYLVKGGDLLPLLTTLVRHLNPGAAVASAPEHVSSRI